jgi:hypothetical protein
VVIPPTAPAPAPVQEPPRNGPPRGEPPPPSEPPREEAPARSIAGIWRISDSPTFGAGVGETYTFIVTIRQDGGSVSGSGDGLVLNGSIAGRSVEVSYTQGQYSGTFSWQLNGNGRRMVGSFTNSSGNGGISVAERVD